MKWFKKLTAILVSVCVIISSFSICSYASSKENILSSSNFLEMAGKLVTEYDTPLFFPETSEEITLENCNRLIIKTVTNDNLTDDRNAIAKVEGWNSIHILQYASEQETKEALEFFSNQSFVEYVEEDRYIEFSPCASTEGIYSEEPLSWGNCVVKSDLVNEAILKSNLELNEIVVGVFDTGLNTNHQYFSDNGRILEGYNIFEQNNNVSTLEPHGAQVAGVILNNTLSNVKIKMYKLGSTLSVTNTQASSLFGAAIFSAVNDDKVDAINMSFSFNDYFESEYIDEAFNYAFENNVPIVVAAGNDLNGEGNNADEAYFASKETVIAVAAIDKNLTPMLKSKNGEISTNYGKCIDIAAPGEKIKSVNMVSGFMEDSGTSLATPFVTAAVATLKSVKPNISCKEVTELVKSKATVPSNWNTFYGSGILNIENMLSDMFTVSPTISFNNNYDVIITANSKDAVIYYTTDNTDPIIGKSEIYNSPINTSNVISIKAVACEKGKLTSAISTLNINWSEDIKIRYKGKQTIDLLGEIERYYCTNEEIVSFDGKKIKGHSIGNASVVIFYETGQRVEYNVKVKFADWQIIHKFFHKYFGILLWSF